jgi:transposase
MAAAVGISAASVRRIWHANGLKPHRIETFTVSNDKRFAEKIEAIVGLYRNPPEHALVLCCDEKSQLPALDRTPPGLPLKRGRAQTLTPDYKRNGTTTLFAALPTLDGAVIGQCRPRHRPQGWLTFLRQNERETRPGLDLSVDHDATHKHPKVGSWLKRHPRFPMHFTPPRASWLNMVERLFRDLSQKAIERGVFPSVPELINTIENYVENHNRDPQPFIWTARASDILAKVVTARARLNKLQSV